MSRPRVDRRRRDEYAAVRLERLAEIILGALDDEGAEEWAAELRAVAEYLRAGAAAPATAGAA